MASLRASLACAPASPCGTSSYSPARPADQRATTRVAFAIVAPSSGARRAAGAPLSSSSSVASKPVATRRGASSRSGGSRSRFECTCSTEAPATGAKARAAGPAGDRGGFPSWMPADVAGLTEAASIAQAMAYQKTPVPTPLIPEPIETAYVRLDPEVPNMMSFIYPVVCLHGFDSNSFEYRRLLPLLAQRTEAYAVDMLGFGFTDRSLVAGWDSYPRFNSTVGPEAMRRHLYAFWRHVVRRPMTLVGASLGGAAAIDFALEFPKAVHQLVLIDSAGYDLLPGAAKCLFPPVDRLAMEYLRSTKLREQAGTMSYVDTSLSTPDAVLCGRLHTRLPRWVEANIDFMKSGGFRVRDRIVGGEVQQETLVIWGEQDQIVPVASADRFVSDIARSRLEIIRECGHVPHLEKPRETAEAILQFMEQPGLL